MRPRPTSLLTARAWRWLAIPFASGLLIYAYAHGAPTSRKNGPAEQAYFSPWSLIPR